jgi:hypothetical protein
MSATALRRIAISFILIATTLGLNAKASGPAPPQAQEQPGQPITLEVDAHSSLFADPLWSSGSQGTCRYLTNPSSSEWFVPIGSQTEWQSMETSSDNQYSENYATQQVCCRPAPPVDSFCSGGTVLSISNVAGPDVDGYGKVGASGTSTAQCQDPYGYYEESHTYSCKVTGSGITADGVWQYAANQGDTCTSSPSTTYGACSTAGVGGWGNELVTITDCLGRVLSSSYIGPACYVTPPCTNNYVKTGCSGTTAIYSQEGTCGGGGFTVPGGCSLVQDSYPLSCSPTCPSYESPPGSGNIYTDCSCEGNWASCPGTQSNYGYSCVTDYNPSGPIEDCSLITSLTCTVSSYQ